MRSAVSTLAGKWDSVSDVSAAAHSRDSPSLESRRPLWSVSAQGVGFVRRQHSVQYGLVVVATSLKFRLQKVGHGRFRILNPRGRKLLEDFYHEVRDPRPQGGHS